HDRRGIWVDRGCNGEFQVQAESELGAGDSSGKSCEKTVGKPVANELVRQCVQVSPVTHASCNVQNSCKLIEDEIQRGCGLLGVNAPAFCGENKGEVGEPAANALVPPNMRALFEGGDTSLNGASNALDFALKSGNRTSGCHGEPLFYNLYAVRLRAPVITQEVLSHRRKFP